jgi:dTMP kinase
MMPMTEVLLFSAARAQLVGEVIRPYLAAGGIVLCDRYADSTYAYQGYGLGRGLDDLHTITEMATGGLQPDLTIYLDLSAEEGLERKQLKRQGARGPGARGQGLGVGGQGPESKGNDLAGAGQPAQATGHSPGAHAPVEWNRLDARELAFHQRVEAGYRSLIAESPERWRIFDARGPIETLAGQIRADAEPFLERVRLLEPL